MKPTLSPQQIERRLRTLFPALPTTPFLRPLVEGEESQAFAFDAGGQPFIVRINPARAGFDKDAYAHRHFCTPNLRVPRIHHIGSIGAAHFACISQRLPGQTLQAADAATLAHSLGPTLAAWRAIGATDISSTTGYGPFDATGHAPFASWRDFLHSAIGWSDEEWRRLGESLAGSDVPALRDHLHARIDPLPETRSLLHGDFGSNNVLVHAQGPRRGAISGVLDWEDARYGDPLFDLAGAYFWRPWLRCMARFADYCEAQLAQLPGYRARIDCYQLWVGLRELHENLQAGNEEMAGWLARRVGEII